MDKQMPCGECQALRAKVLERDRNACQHCGSQDDLSCDHIIAVIHGGKTTYENLQTLCMPCNLKKGVALEVAA